MKKLLCIALLGGVMACPHAPANTHPTADSTPGASSARGAVQKFFDAVRAGDLQAMSVAWGTTQGPTRETIERAELEKREVVLRCYFNHDSYRILDEAKGSRGQLFQVQLTRGDLKRTTTVTTVQGPNQRWYVETLDIAAVRDLCGSSPTNP